jgi:hypothetical protein
MNPPGELLESFLANKGLVPNFTNSTNSLASLSNE